MKPNSYRNRKQAFDRLCMEAKVGQLPWDSITADHIEAWVRMHDWFGLDAPVGDELRHLRVHPLL